ncbi:MAG TPA: hypothetical protein VEZ55_13985 [Chitinophagaceae bacterium]|nr:hypothetical protein [Chitinophagaceae bacterium]
MRKFYLLVSTILVLFACKSPSKLYERGNYNDAIDASIKKLQKNPGDAEAKTVLKQSYHYAVSRHEDEIRILAKSSNENRYDQLYQQYDRLQDLYEKIRRYPSAFNYVKPTDYSSYLETYKDKAAEVHMERGLQWMEREDKLSSREAYREFKTALRYKPQNFDIKRKMEEAFDAAVVNILLIPLDAYQGSYYYSNNSYQMRNFQDRVLRQLNYNSGNEFIRFYEERDARTKRIRPDEILEIRMGRMNMGQPYDQNSSRKVSKDVVVKETVFSKDSVVKEYAKVHATITTTKRVLVSDVDMFITARDDRGRMLWSDNFKGEHRWQTEFASYTGDERALSDSDKTAINKKDKTPPREDAVAEELLQRLESDITHRLRNYYNRYQ